MSSSCPRPVFVHSGWRCSSTYVWSRFRALRGVRAYYEPWHEQLARLDEARIAAETPAASGLRHPGGAEPYLAEFRSLLVPGGGVLGYQDRFALTPYMLEPDVEDPAQQAYVEGLIGAARAAGAVPVLACCRTLGRIDWLKRRVGGFHIVLIRDPLQQWMSFHSLRRRPRPTYFELCQYVMLSELPGQAAAAEALLGRRFEGRGSLAERIAAVRGRLKRAPASVSFAAFLAVYVASYLRALPQADLVIDVDRLASDPGYARGVEAAIRAGCGLSPDFSDCRAPARHAPLDLPYRHLARRVVDLMGVRPALAAPQASLLYGKLASAFSAMSPNAPSLGERLRSWLGGPAPAKRRLRAPLGRG